MHFITKMNIYYISFINLGMNMPTQVTFVHVKVEIKFSVVFRHDLYDGCLFTMFVICYFIFDLMTHFLYFHHSIFNFALFVLLCIVFYFVPKYQPQVYSEVFFQIVLVNIIYLLRFCLYFRYEDDAVVGQQDVP